MAMEDTESCSSRSVESPTHHPKQQRHKLEVYNKVLQRLKNSGVVRQAGFDDDVWAHFNRLPARYALDVNVERAEDVLTHARLLQLAVDPANRPAFDVRVVQVLPAIDEGVEREDISLYFSRHSLHPPPAFGSSSNLEVLPLETNKSQLQDGDCIKNINNMIPRPMHEITFSADDRPKLLSQLTSLLAEIGLNIQEAHAFSTNDGYSLDVFVVEGWPYEETEQLRQELQREILKFKKRSMSNSMPKFISKSMSKSQKSPLILDKASDDGKFPKEQIQIPTDAVCVWEIDFKLLKFEKKVASGSYGDLYRGTYCSQDVAIKVLKSERVSVDMQNDFAHEVFMMTKVRHKNIVQFIGACTKHPNLCIVTEFMSRGSVYDFLHKHKGMLDLSAIIRVATDVSKGMNYLHQNKIIHRDLKAANLLMDENDVVKVGDFGVSRVICETGVMTAETGTYRWMAPEVIEHKPYDHKADIFSFAIVLWELLTGKIPYELLTPLQAAVGVVQSTMRPNIPKNTHHKIKDLLQKCWQQDPTLRPEFSEILDTLQVIAKEVESDPDRRRKNKAKPLGGIFSALKRG